MPDPQESLDAEPSSEKELIVRPLEFCTLYTLFVSCYMHCLLFFCVVWLCVISLRAFADFILICTCICIYHSAGLTTVVVGINIMFTVCHKPNHSEWEGCNTVHGRRGR